MQTISTIASKREKFGCLVRKAGATGEQTSNAMGQRWHILILLEWGVVSINCPSPSFDMPANATE